MLSAITYWSLISNQRKWNLVLTVHTSSLKSTLMAPSPSNDVLEPSNELTYVPSLSLTDRLHDSWLRWKEEQSAISSLVGLSVSVCPFHDRLLKTLVLVLIFIVHELSQQRRKVSYVGVDSVNRLSNRLLLIGALQENEPKPIRWLAIGPNVGSFKEGLL